MDVAIYEVNKSRPDAVWQSDRHSDGARRDSRLNLGGIGLPSIHRGTTQAITPGTSICAILGSTSIAFGLPISNFCASDKNNTKIVASTQIHAFNNEDSSATIGQTGSGPDGESSRTGTRGRR